MKSYAVIMIILLAIALISIGLILSPVVTHHVMGFNQEVVTAQAATTVEGLRLRAETWKEYPEYNIGLGIIAGLSFVGSMAMCRLMYLVRERQEDAQGTKSRG